MTTSELTRPPVAPASVIDPAILYVGTPVVLLSTVNPDGTANLAPISSVFFLNDRCVLGLSPASATWANAARTGELVVGLPSAAMVTAVDRLALTTGRPDVPAYKVARGYRHVADKFAHAGLTPVASDRVEPPRTAECPISVEVTVDRMSQDGAPVVDTRVRRVHVHADVRLAGHANRIDPDAWRPLIMSFQHFYGLAPGRLQPSRLATIDEDAYRD